MWEIIAEYKGEIAAVFAGLNTTILVFFKRWASTEFALLQAKADDRYEAKRPPMTVQEQMLYDDAMARRVLSTPCINEFAQSTVLSAYRDPRFQDKVEHIVENSVPIERKIDARVKHGFNNFDSTLSLALTTLGDRLQDGVRKSLSESQAIQMEALSGLRDSVQSLAKTVGEHIAADDARREAAKG